MLEAVHRRELWLPQIITGFFCQTSRLLNRSLQVRSRFLGQTSRLLNRSLQVRSVFIHQTPPPLTRSLQLINIQLILIKVLPWLINYILLILIPCQALKWLKSLVFCFITHVSYIFKLFELSLNVSFANFGVHLVFQILDLFGLSWLFDVYAILWQLFFARFERVVAESFSSGLLCTRPSACLFLLFLSIIQPFRLLLTKKRIL